MGSINKEIDFKNVEDKNFSTFLLNNIPKLLLLGRESTFSSLLAQLQSQSLSLTSLFTEFSYNFYNLIFLVIVVAFFFFLNLFLNSQF